MWAKISSIILRNRILILSIVGLLTVVMFYFSRRVEMSFQMAQILPPSDKTYQDYKKFRAVFGEEANVIILAIKDPDFFKKTNLQAWMKFEESIKKIPFVEWTLSPASSFTLTLTDSLVYKDGDTLHQKKFVNAPLIIQAPTNDAQADSIAKKFASLPFYKGVIWNPDSNAFIMLAGLNKEVIHKKKRSEIVDSIQAKVEIFEKNNGKDIHLSGLPFIRTAIVKTARKETLLFTLLAAVVSSIILLIFFKSMRVLVVTLLQVAIGVVWSWGTMGMLGYDITSVTGIIPPLLIVIGIPNAIYMVTKYQQEFLKVGNKIRALNRMMEKTGRAMFLINITTAVGFATLIITPGKMLMEFGVVATINCMLLFFLSLVLNPILFSYLPAPSKRHTRHLTNKRSNWFIEFQVKLVEKYRGAIYVISAILLVFSIVGMFRIKPSGKVADDVPKHSKTYADLNFFENNFTGVMPFEVMIDTKKKNKVIISGNLWKKVDALQDSISSLNMFSHPVSIIEVMKYGNQAFYNGVTNQYQVPNQFDKMKVLEYFKRGLEDKKDVSNQSYIDTAWRYVRIRAQMKDMGTYEMDAIVKRIEQQAKTVFEAEDVEVTITGASVVILKGTQYLLRNLISSISVAIIIIALMMASMFRKFKMVIISLIPNVLPLIFTAGVMGFFDIPLKASTIIIYGIAFGITVDSTIHFLAKYLQELKYYKGDIKTATYSSIKETALSMAYTSMVLFFGFSVFIASDFGGTKALGILLSFTLLMGFFCNLTLLPSLLLTLNRKKIDKDYDKYAVIDDDDDHETAEEPTTEPEVK
jgi:predicted RND superfamily exporter protein